MGDFYVQDSYIETMLEFWSTPLIQRDPTFVDGMDLKSYTVLMRESSMCKKHLIYASYDFLHSILYNAIP